MGAFDAAVSGRGEGGGGELTGKDATYILGPCSSPSCRFDICIESVLTTIIPNTIQVFASTLSSAVRSAHEVIHV